MTLAGHGVLGLRDKLRTFSDLVEESSAERRSLLEMAPGFEMAATGWDRHSGDCWQQPARFVFGDVLHDIVSVETSVEPKALTRVETKAVCVSTAGTYFFDPDEAATEFEAVDAWDDDVTLWDQVGAVWDVYEPGPLYVHLPDGSNPSVATVVAGVGFYFGERGEVHPHLGVDKLTNGDFDTWTSATDAAGWTEGFTGTGFITPTRESVIVKEGNFSVRLETTGGVSGADGYSHELQTLTTMVLGEPYRFSGSYYTDDAFDNVGLGAFLIVTNGAGTTFLRSDGRNTDATALDLRLSPTAGEWRRFCFDFLAIDTTMIFQARIWKLLGTYGAGKLYFDDLKLQRIWRFNFYEPRLGASSLPDTESAKAAVHFGGKTIGLGSVAVLNGDGALDAAFGRLLLLDRPVSVHDGGTFLDGQELLRDDHRTGFVGFTRDVEADDTEIQFDLEDIWTFAAEPLPPRVYSRSEFPNARGEADGEARPLLFGRRSFYGVDGDSFDMIGPIQPIRISANANGYGVYEICDPTNAPGPIEPFPTGS